MAASRRQMRAPVPSALSARRPLRPVEATGLPKRDARSRERECSRRSDHHQGQRREYPPGVHPAGGTSISLWHACVHPVLLVSGWLASPSVAPPARVGASGADRRGLSGRLLLLSAQRAAAGGSRAKRAVTERVGKYRKRALATFRTFQGGPHDGLDQAGGNCDLRSHSSSRGRHPRART